jgi:methionine-S-sulfoxide reductase
MKSSLENELIELRKTDGSSFEIFAKDIQKTVGRLSFQPGQKAEIDIEIQAPYRHRHYASNALYLFDQYGHDAYHTAVFHACIDLYNEDAKHVLEHNGYEKSSADEEHFYYEHHRQETRKDDAYHPAGMKVLYFAGGCFWGTERVFQMLDGVIETTVGYANGHTPDPTYEEVCRHGTGYKETVRVTYDPSVIATDTVMHAYFLCIDPTLKNQQGNDYGEQYQTGVYYRDVSLLPVIEKVFAEERQKHAAFFVECRPLECFYEAEEYHQDYLQKNPNGYCHITPVELAAVKKLNRR